MKFITAVLALFPLAYAAPATQPALAALSSRSQGTVFVCDDGDFKGHCIKVRGANGTCVNFPTAFNDVVSSLGPDPGQVCFFFVDLGCAGAKLGPIRVPGLLQLGDTAFNNKLSSFKCSFE
ncbi:hypothetical protein DFH09DRAFT_1146143 [Mycena vulgaris]|nr:hypothetical protein DFH09DRAFT_293858 [Mycena vulgaris]KAJ6580571.1 hypothetical protein DFH09DRAFT_1146143 [Mycena vulgaris]